VARLPIAFTGATVDRVADVRRRDPHWLAAQLRQPGARAVVAGDGEVAVSGPQPRLALVPLAAAGGGEPVLLGLDDRGPVFAVNALDGSAERLGLREAGALLPHAEAGLAAYAAALLNWHRRHPRCSVCGAPTDVAEGGLMRHCPACGTEHHPRTDPVVIVLVSDGDRALLGRQAVWPAGRYSALAGFVAPGESLEEAVAREVAEESGVTVRDPAYVASQPWPFPSSLMLGFAAAWAAGEPAVGDEELEDVRWFSRPELAAARRGAGPLLLPPPEAIARALIERWLDGE
jgi:NAD+ diphosphatase